jgi:glycosyltransferase involved in cell wall biosynthesis
MDRVITNSKNVKKRIQKFLGIDAEIVYPPCEINKFQWVGQGNYYLSAARLDPLKRVDIIVDAFVRMPDQRLIIISDGSEMKTIQKKTSGCDNIKVLGYVSDTTYYKILGECIATIYIPKDEDFGMTPIESMAAGKPVIGVSEGGLLESIRQDETGTLLNPDPKAEDIIKAVRHFGKNRSKELKHLCQERAREFDVSVFMLKISNLIK